jgi:hypothetical protein
MLGLAGGLAFSPVVFTGCGTTPAARAVQVSDAAKVTVEAALGAWDAYIVANHPPLNQQAAVKRAWQRYQATQLVVLDTALILKEAETTGTNKTAAQAAMDSAIANAGQAIADLVALIRQFGAKI